MLAVIWMRKRERELFTLVLLSQLCAGSNLDEEERVVYFSFVALAMCWQ